MKRVIIGLVALITLGVGLAFIVSKGGQEVVTDSTNSKNSTEQVNETVRPVSTVPDLVLGSPSAKITITEFADFKCPTCNKFVRTTYPELKKEYIDTGKAKIVFRNLPFIADDSRTAAEGAYCSNAQGKFSQYHDLLYSHIWEEYYAKGKIQEGEFGDVFTVAQLTEIVKSIEIDQSKFETCLNEGLYKDAVTSDLKLSEQAGATGTPTFIVGSQKFTGAQNFGFFDKLIRSQQ